MRSIFRFFLPIIFFAILFNISILRTSFAHPNASENFSIYKKEYNKTYLRSYEEHRSEKAFIENNLVISEHNRRFQNDKPAFRIGTTFFSDMDHKTYLNSQLRLLESQRSSKNILDPENLGSPLSERVPRSLDWRREGFTTDLENQDDCGSCYAFSIAGSIEGQFFKRTGKVLKLSSQQIVDCSDTYGNHGCTGGSLRNTLKYLSETGGIMTADHYPYLSKKGKCHFLKELSVINVSSWKLLPFEDEDSMEKAVALTGPVAISINASPKTFQLYREGIYEDMSCTPNEVNHAMLVVGYGADYWILKNWWGDHWGEKGYMRIKKGVNMCGIANYAAYVEL